jgi:hypothetical protein
MFNLVDVFGKPAKAKSLVSAVYFNLEDPTKSTDIKKSVTLVNEKATVALDTKI